MTVFKTPCRNGSASDSRSEGCVFESRRGQSFSTLRLYQNMHIPECQWGGCNFVSFNHCYQSRKLYIKIIYQSINGSQFFDLIIKIFDQNIFCELINLDQLHFDCLKILASDPKETKSFWIIFDLIKFPVILKINFWFRQTSDVLIFWIWKARMEQDIYQVII